MTPQELAILLNGREYGREITDDEANTAYDAGLVVVFGYSDDNVEFRGAIDDEIGCYEGRDVFVTKTGVLENKCSNDFCPYHEKEKADTATISAVWDHAGYSWIYETDIPHATFDILEDGEKYCRGIVFSLNEVK